MNNSEPVRTELGLDAAAGCAPIAVVALDVPLSDGFDFIAPPELALAPGDVVRVPFGRGARPAERVGVVVALRGATGVPAHKLKTVIARQPIPALSKGVLSLANFAANYYHAGVAELLQSALPPGLKRPVPVIAKRLNVARIALGEWSADQLLARIPARRTLQRRIVTLLEKGPVVEATIRASATGAAAALRDLLALGWVQRDELPAYAPHDPNAITLGVTLNADQQAAATRMTDAIAACVAGRAVPVLPVLLHGITGSGKTEVYLHAIAACRAHGRQALLLVPEINLTPQLIGIIAARFPGETLATAHSSLAEGERARHWIDAASGAAGIVIGTRLAVWQSLPHLGLIVVDEEHDASFKQQEGVRFSARDLAVVRARIEGVPIVLGSATPSLESWENARAGRYQLARLPERANPAATLPTLLMVEAPAYTLQHGLSPTLIQALEDRLARGEQSLVFLNRRGYAPVLFCGQCSWVSGCKRCAVKTVFHARDKVMRCHHCGFEAAVPKVCPTCGNPDLKPLGHGTERLEATLTERLPTARILRIDRDAMSRKGSFEAAVKSIRLGEVDILIGTQMLAKGHDYPNVTLVGVLGSDSALFASDFRATERLFAQLTQVAGRAGRAEKPGVVLIQTEFAGHPAYQAVIAQDFAAFANDELVSRQALGLPPYRYLAILRVESQQHGEALQFCERAREIAQQLVIEQLTDASKILIFDAIEPLLAKRAEYWRAQLLVSASERAPLHTLLSHWQPALQGLAGRQPRWLIELDPLEV